MNSANKLELGVVGSYLCARSLAPIGRATVVLALPLLGDECTLLERDPSGPRHVRSSIPENRKVLGPLFFFGFQKIARVPEEALRLKGRPAQRVCKLDVCRTTVEHKLRSVFANECYGAIRSLVDLKFDLPRQRKGIRLCCSEWSCAAFGVGLGIKAAEGRVAHI